MCKITSVNTNCDHLSTQKKFEYVSQNSKILCQMVWLSFAKFIYKGQLISKGPFDVFKSPQKPTKLF